MERRLVSIAGEQGLVVEQMMLMSSAYMPDTDLIQKGMIGGHFGTSEEMAETFHNIGSLVFQNLINSGLVSLEARILDVGCGLGRIARWFTQYLTTGSYVGIDVVRSSIEWCQKAYDDLPSFRFVYADVANSHYNRGAAISAANYRFPVDTDSCDFVFLTSLFTHMMPAGVRNYLAQIARVLRPGGHTWNTFLLLDDKGEEFALLPKKNGLTATARFEGGLTRDVDDQDQLTMHREERVIAMHEDAGLEIVEVHHCGWDGRYGKVWPGQDRIVARLET